MIKPFNSLNVDISCVGNHELDMGIEHGKKLIAETNCPWILTNLVEKDKGRKPLCGVEPFHVLEHSGFKIGFLGFAEEAWLDQFKPDVDISNIEYLDYDEQLEKYSEILREEHKCDLVISLNHMRVPDDIKMARECKRGTLDMIFGGHDHVYYRELSDETDVFIQKSGTDFEDFSNVIALFDVNQNDYETFMEELKKQATSIGYDMSLIEVFYSSYLERMFISERIPITGKFAPDFELMKHVDFYMKDIKKKLDGYAGSTGPQLEARFSRLRTEETNLGNMIADLIRTQFSTDFGLINAGSLRANQLIESGPFKWRLVSQLCPMEDNVFKVKIKGNLLKQVLENAVSMWPKMDGRWPLVSGIRFSFDPTKPPGDRIPLDSIKDSEGTDFDVDKIYSVAVNNYLAQGKDGFEAFLDPSIQKCNFTEEDEIDIREILAYFLKSFQKTEEEEIASAEASRQIMRERMKLLKSRMDQRCEVNNFLLVYPEVEGRIVNLGDPI